MMIRTKRYLSFRIAYGQTNRCAGENNLAFIGDRGSLLV